MSASTSDKITDVRNAARPNSTTVASPRAAAGNTLSCTNLVGWPTASKVHFVTYQIDSSSNPIAGTQLDCSGIVSGNSITSVSVLDGSDTGNSVGDIVEMLPTASWAQDLADAIGIGHERTGVHKAALPLNSPVLTTPVIADFTSATHTHASNATGGKLNGTNAITANTLFSNILGLSNALDPTNGVQTQANAGTAGGTMYYINLGGIKLLWLITSQFAVNAALVEKTVTFPTFFTTVQGSWCVAQNYSVGQRMVASINSVTTTGCLLDCWDTSGSTANSSAASILVIGT